MDITDCVMSSGCRSKACCPANEVDRCDRSGQPSVRGSALPVRAGIPGVTFRNASATGRTSTVVSAAGQNPVSERVFQHLAEGADNEYAMIDSTIVRCHQHSAGAKKSRRGSGHRAFARRAGHRDPPPRRCRQQSR